MFHLTKADLYDEVEAIISAADFVEKTQGAQLLVISSTSSLDDDRTSLGGLGRVPTGASGILTPSVNVGGPVRNVCYRM
jgi:hypothetical protein